MAETRKPDRVRKSVLGMLHADDNASAVSKSPEGLSKMITAIVNVFEAARLTVSQKERKKICYH